MAASIVLTAFAQASAQLHNIERVSLGTDDNELDANSSGPAITTDGRYVTFMSEASSVDGCMGIESGSTGVGGLAHIYLRDRQAGTTECVSRATDETPANGTSESAAVSGNGRFVVFISRATNLVIPTPSARPHVYIRDRVLGTTQLVTVAADGITEANSDSLLPKISEDGLLVAFESFASNLIAGGTTTNRRHVYVRDLPAGITSLVSVGVDGSTEGNGNSQGPSITPDGRFIAFRSQATNLLTEVDANGGASDVFLHDLSTGETELVSVASDGTQANGASSGGAVSADARIVVFASAATNLAPGNDPARFLFVRDRSTQTISLIAVATSDRPETRFGSNASVSADGRMVAFRAVTSPFTTSSPVGHFLHDRAIQATVFLTDASGGPPGALTAQGPALTADGRILALDSNRSTLVEEDTNSRMDVFASRVKRYSVDVGVYRASEGTWYMLRAFDGSALATGWGSPAFGDVPVFADYDGDGRADIAVYRPTTGEWFIAFSSGGARTMAWGSPALEDQPIPADFDGDGKADVAVYRHGTGEWLVAFSNGGFRVMGWGAPSLDDVPVPADFDGDGIADVAVYRRSTGEWFIALSSGGASVKSWGSPSLGDVPVPGDYDGDGTADLAVYRATTGEWFVRISESASMHVNFGSPELRDVPVPADYDDDGTTDFAVYRQSTGDWFIWESSSESLRSVAWGAEAFGDIPVTLPPAY